MKQLTCEMCGGTDLIKQDGVFVCQSCGCKYSVDEAKKMMIEGTVDVSGSTIKLDNSKRLSNMYQLAENDIDKNDCGNALKYYEQIIIEEPNSWEAHFFISYIKAWTSTRKDIIRVSEDFCENYKTVIPLIKENLPQEQISVAIKTLYDRSIKLFDMLNSAITTMYQEDLDWQPLISSQPSISEAYEARCRKNNNDTKAKNNMIYRAERISQILSLLGDEINNCFPEESDINKFAVDLWKKYLKKISEFSSINPEVARKINNEYLDKIKKYEPDYSLVSSIPGVTKEKMNEIEQALNNNNKNEAIKICKECSGMGLSEAKSTIDKLIIEKGIFVETPQKKGGAESWMRYFALMGCVPNFFFLGIFVLFFINKAINENGGTLSKNAKKYLIMGIVSFCVWILLLIILIASFS